MSNFLFFNCFCIVVLLSLFISIEAAHSCLIPSDCGFRSNIVELSTRSEHSLTSAILSVSENGIVRLTESGVYPIASLIQIDKSFVLESDENIYATIFSEDSSSAVRIISSASVTLRRIHFHGISVNVQSKNLHISETSFFGNGTNNSTCLSVHNVSEALEIYNTTFSECVSNHSGGALDVSKCSSVTLIDNIFDRNGVIDDIAGGGAVHIAEVPIVNVKGNTFRANFVRGTVEAYGAGIYLSSLVSSFVATFDSNYFVGNSLSMKSLGGGSSIAFTNSSSILQNITLVENLFIDGEVSFCSNGGDGLIQGGVVMLEPEIGNLVLKKNQFRIFEINSSNDTECEANADQTRILGGVVYVLHTSSFTSSHDWIEHAHIQVGGDIEGGLVFLSVSDSVDMSSCCLDYNVMKSEAGSYYGGALSIELAGKTDSDTVDGDLSISISNCSLRSNYFVSVVSGDLFGGLISLIASTRTSAIISMKNNLFQSNQLQAGKGRAGEGGGKVVGETFIDFENFESIAESKIEFLSNKFNAEWVFSGEGGDVSGDSLDSGGHGGFVAGGVLYVRVNASNTPIMMSKNTFEYSKILSGAGGDGGDSKCADCNAGSGGDGGDLDGAVVVVRCIGTNSPIYYIDGNVFYNNHVDSGTGGKAGDCLQVADENGLRVAGNGGRSGQILGGGVYLYSSTSPVFVSSNDFNGTFCRVSWGRNGGKSIGSSRSKAGDGADAGSVFGCALNVHAFESVIENNVFYRNYAQGGHGGSFLPPSLILDAACGEGSSVLGGAAYVLGLPSRDDSSSSLGTIRIENNNRFLGNRIDPGKQGFPIGEVISTTRAPSPPGMGLGGALFVLPRSPSSFVVLDNGRFEGNSIYIDEVGQRRIEERVRKKAGV